MMKPQFLLPIFVVSGFLLGPATAATSWNGTATDNIADAANWSDGLPAIGNQGTLAGDAAWANSSSTANDMNGWDLVMTGGTLTDNAGGYARNEIYGGTTINVQGGTWNRSTAAIRLHGGAAVTVSGGTLNWNGIAAISAAVGGGQNGGFTLNVSDGVVNMTKLINFNNQANNSYINISGGTTTMGEADAYQLIDEPNTFFTVSGGSLTLGEFTMDATENNITMTISGGGLLTTGGYNPNSTDGLTDQRYVNFLPDTTGAWTRTGASKADFETYWANDTLLYNGGGGSGGAAFDDAFLVTGSTLTLIPEPASSAFLLLGLAALGLRRRR